ncbi:PD-(D/E)XK nuclease family protein [Clostridium sporogenes]|uniref:PD-(D/E)XK nuclease family protein n=1 Tax=Clostridium sporogenes TaxID=1509 RepID=UPI00223902D4|nr:PD-(D/E)XK nuclease family protein [Clostridium sporogenes]MCW6094601.1 PD-(D/E)XK nuclease family protein [Clostridium sporogenes]
MGLAKKVDLSSCVEVDSRGNELAGALFNQFNTFHSRDYRPDKGVENISFQQRLLEFNLIGVKTPRPNMQIFSPSGASKCARELYYKALGYKAEDDKYPYHRRWTRNSTAVHEVVQKDLLYMSKILKNPAFTVKMMDNGLPAWEENLKTFVEVEHNGVEFAVLGMMDGVLNYKDGTEVGFEFKTKSNSIGQVGNYKMKAPAPYHLEQCTAYSILFGMDEFILMYESVAKDQWAKGAEAKSDIRTFYYKVTEEERTKLLDKFATVTKAIENREIPEKQPDKCMFCPYKSLCEGGN